ncbi:hypothetical protein [Kutzneria sp. NPDC051319]|uniref:hypothetical protein n=1 Tax=Kutzneria sp. NPDC051319 TaxID=3155047 RepID=UPI003424A56A
MTARLTRAAVGLILLAALAGCGARFVDTHSADDGPVTGPAVALAHDHRLGPDGFGQLRLGMALDQAVGTGQVSRTATGDLPGCRTAVETGATPARGGGVWVSAKYGVAKIEAYAGVSTPEGVALGAGLDDVRRAYPDTVKETEKDMGDGRIDMDDHYRAPVPGNPTAAYRFFVDAHDHVDAMLLVLAKQDCDVGYPN